MKRKRVKNNVKNGRTYLKSHYQSGVAAVSNQQGDVINILDNTGGVAVTYDYNAWGRILNSADLLTQMVKFQV